MKFVLIAHGLKNRSGHHYMEARSFREEAARHKIKTCILARHDINPPVRDELQAVPLFTKTPYKNLYKRWDYKTLLSFWSYGWRMSRELSSLPADTVCPQDIVVSPLTKAQDLYSMALWLAKLSPRRRPFVAINFMVDDISGHAVTDDRQGFHLTPAKCYRFAFNRLQRLLPRERLLLSAGGARFAHTVSGIIDHPVQLFPLPVQHDLPGTDTMDQADLSSPLIVYLGHMRVEKGADLVGAVIARVLKQHETCRFLLQANPDEWAKEWRVAIGGTSRRIQMHRGEMSQGEYQEAMKNGHIVLLPYRPECYMLQTSGIFSEAMAMGRVCIIPENTWMADMARSYGEGCVVYDRHDPDCIAEAILTGLENLPRLNKNMLGISRQWKDTMGMKSFVQRILDAAQSCT